MRGKRIDIEFVGNFIAECLSKNIMSSEDIVVNAKSKIKEIDEKIIEVEKLKKIRSKLLDVVLSFDKKENSNYPTIDLFNIKNHNLCKKICYDIKNNPIKFDNYKHDEEMIFCIKQLIKYKVIIKTSDILDRGIRYNEYINMF